MIFLTKKRLAEARDAGIRIHVRDAGGSNYIAYRGNDYAFDKFCVYGDTIKWTILCRLSRHREQDGTPAMHGLEKFKRKRNAAWL